MNIIDFSVGLSMLCGSFALVMLSIMIMYEIGWLI